MNPETAKYIRPLLTWERDCIMSVQEFRDAVKQGAFVDYDGFGHPMKDDKTDGSVYIYPSDHLDTIPDDATHIVWYNK
jgi:hypothetical protein